MRVYAALLAALLAVTAPAQAQAPASLNRLCLSSDPCDSRAPASSAPLGYAKEDWSPRYAPGLARLSTLVPMALGSVLLRVHLSRASDPSLSDPLAATGLGLASVGAVVGPSMGAWCLGGDCARQSWLPFGVRVAGVGGMAGAWWIIRRELDQAEAFEGIALAVLSPLVLLPGAMTLLAGIGWGLRRTPRLRCGTGADAPTLSVWPAASINGGGSGLALRLTL